VIVLRADSANELYSAACRAVLSEGRPTSPRGLATTEILGAHLCLTDPRRRYVDVPPVRVINPAFAVAEALWILSGSDDPWIFRYNRTLTRYADDGRLQGAYGPRMRRWQGQVDQLDRVRRLLAADPDTRQAVIQLFDPARDSKGYRDVPCTLGYRFFLRGGKLHMHTTMRSQDLWLGFPYDIFTTTLLQELLAGWLGVELGEYHHHVDSLHLYEEHQLGASHLPASPSPSPAMEPMSVAWEDIAEQLDEVINGGPRPDGPWREFAQVLASYRAWTGDDRAQARVLAAMIEGPLGVALLRWYHRLAAPEPSAAAGGPR